MHGFRSSMAMAFGLTLVLGIETVGTQTPPAPDVAGRWRLVSVDAPPNTAIELTVTGLRTGGLPAQVSISPVYGLSIQRGYATGLVTENYRMDAPAAGTEFEAKQVGNTLVLAIRGWMSRGAAPSTPNREEVWSIRAASELTVDVTERLGNGPPVRSRLTYRRVVASARPGENLVTNADASRSRADWLFFGDANVEPCGGDPCFVLRNHGSISQTVLLPDSAAGQYLVAIGSGASERVEATITGKPSLYGVIGIADGSRFVGYLQGQQLRAESPATNQWVTMSGVFPLPTGAARIGFQLNQAEARNFPQTGSAARFDDVGLYLFPTETEAREFVDRWKGRAAFDPSKFALRHSGDKQTLSYEASADR